MRNLGSAFAALAILLCALPTQAQATLAPRAVAPTSRFESGILGVERFGNTTGRPIVLIPGLFCGSWEWNAQINALSPAHDLFVVTLPGLAGRSMIQGDDLMKRAAQSLHHLIASQRLKLPVVVGHSLGGTLAVFFAERYPHDVSGVVTVEGGYPVERTQALRDAEIAKQIAPYKGITQKDVGRVVRRTTLQYTITSKRDIDAVEPLAARSDAAAIVAWLRAALSLDLTQPLSRVHVPFTAIVPFDPSIDPYQGFKSKDRKRAAYVRWVAHAPLGEVIVIDHSRHFVMFDRPKEFERALEAAIARSFHFPS
jgi:N-formylmaleamate deformylase